MAKKQETESVLVDCTLCESGSTEAVNFLVDCFNKERNPGGFKVGSWKKECRYYKRRK